MICSDCANTADQNRENHDHEEFQDWLHKHPDNCGCECRHEMPEEWAKQFSVDRP